MPTGPLLSSWFNAAFLLCSASTGARRRWCWKSSCSTRRCTRFQGWHDLRRRSRRPPLLRLFPSGPADEPIIFIEVALTRHERPSAAPARARLPGVRSRPPDAAIFYSITNCQEACAASLSAISDQAGGGGPGREFPRLKTFATLSPIPGFALARRHRRRTARLAELAGALQRRLAERAGPGTNLRTELMRLCAYYLLRAKHELEPADAVGGFTWATARAWNVSTGSPTNPKRLGAFGRHDGQLCLPLKDVERNHELCEGAPRRRLADAVLACAREPAGAPEVQACRVSASMARRPDIPCPRQAAENIMHFAACCARRIAIGRTGWSMRCVRWRSQASSGARISTDAGAVFCPSASSRNYSIRPPHFWRDPQMSSAS